MGRTLTPSGRAELLNRKRRVLSEYLGAGEQIVQAMGDPDQVPMAEDIAPLLERRDKALDDIRALDKRLQSAVADDRAAEIVAENALRRTLESSADLDQIIADALTTWQARLTTTLAELAGGRKTLKGYRSDLRQPHNVVDEAA